LGHCTTRRKVAVWIADDVTGNFHSVNFPATLFPLVEFSLKEMSNRNIPWAGKGGWFLGLMNFLQSFTDNIEIWETQNPETLRVGPAMCRIATRYL